MEFMSLLVALRRGMKEALGIENAYLFQNEDTEHDFHLWVFPRHKWMERFGRKIESVRPIMEHARKEMHDEKTLDEVRDAASRIREYLESLQS
jgi:hypothetical protein